MNRHKYEGAILALLGLIGSSATAMAQDAAQPAPAATTGTAEVGLTAGTTTTTPTTPVLDADANAAAANTATTTTAAPPPPAEPPPLPPPAVDAANQTDHERVIRAYGVGVLGSVRLDNLGANSVTAPMLGLRYWMNEGMGLEFGVGVAHHSGTFSNDIAGQSNVDDPTIWGLAGHAGVPLALFHDKHFTFLVMPEANFGFSTWREADDKNTVGDSGESGRAWLAEVGARAGAEIHFGFIGLPMLSLTGSVGAHVTYRDSLYKSVDAAGNETKQGQYTLDVTTANHNDPWALFTNSISALYYFK